MGGGAIWCGSGCQRFLIGFCLSQVDIGGKSKLTELKGRPWHTFLQTSFCGKNRLGAETGKMAAKRGDLGPHVPRNGSPISPPNRPNFKIVLNNILIARSKKPEQGNLLSQPAPFFFWQHDTRFFLVNKRPHAQPGIGFASQFTRAQKALFINNN
jgi:hypothetical protein